MTQILNSFTFHTQILHSLAHLHALLDEDVQLFLQLRVLPFLVLLLLFHVVQLVLVAVRHPNIVLNLKLKVCGCQGVVTMVM